MQMIHLSFCLNFISDAARVTSPLLIFLKYFYSLNILLTLSVSNISFNNVNDKIKHPFLSLIIEFSDVIVQLSSV